MDGITIKNSKGKQGIEGNKRGGEDTKLVLDEDRVRQSSTTKP
jgi:hypothetical protein